MVARVWAISFFVCTIALLSPPLTKLTGTSVCCSTTTTHAFLTSTLLPSRRNNDHASNTLCFQSPTTHHDADIIKNMEATWRYIKKPFISIGSKGIRPSHGNSLRELLEAHTVVKVKIRTSNTTASFHELVDAAVDSGAPESLELLQVREKDGIVMIGMPGATQRIEEGTFPPPPPEDTEFDSATS